MLDNSHDCIIAHLELKTNSLQNVFLEEADHNNALSHIDISDFVDGYPPLLIYSIHGKPSCTLELKVTLEGVQDHTQLTLHQFHLPGKNYWRKKKFKNYIHIILFFRTVSSSFSTNKFCEQHPHKIQVVTI